MKTRTKAPVDTPTPFLQKLYRAATYPLRLLPDFMIIGTQRGGTTSLYSYLAEHPGIGSASIKEVWFFDSPHFQQGTPWYKGHFPTVWQKYYVEQSKKHPFITGEATPNYLFHPHAPQRIARLLPQVKLIVMLRNPVNRAYSQYYHNMDQRDDGHVRPASFEEALRLEEEQVPAEREKLIQNESYDSYIYRRFSFLARGVYIDQLQNWMRFFPKEQFLILKSEDFYADPAAVVKQTLTFLKLPLDKGKQETTTYEPYNITTPPKMDAAMRERLIEYFKPHNARLYEYLGVNFDWDK